MMNARKHDAHKTAITSFLTKLRKNRENVPAELLKTKYSAAYGQLCGSIKGEIRAMIIDAIPRIWIRQDLAAGAAGAMNSAYTAGGYPERLGQAAFKDMDPEKTAGIAEQAAVAMGAALLKYLEANVDPDRPSYKTA